MKVFHLKEFTGESSFPFHILQDNHENTFPIHSHADFIELAIVIGGSASHIVDDECFPIRKGDVFTIGKNMSHGFSDAVGFRICNIMFSQEDFFGGHSDICDSPSFRSLFYGKNGLQTKLTLPPEEFIRVCEILKILQTEYSTDSDGRETLIRSYFMMLTVMLSRLYASKESGKNRSAENITAAAEFIERNFTEKLTLDSIAEVTHYSSRHFVRIFTETYHQTPQEYILSLRMRRAFTLLEEGELSIEETAQQSGFGDGNYFCRVFKKQTGVTPGEYRRTVQQSKNRKDKLYDQERKSGGCR